MTCASRHRRPSARCGTYTLVDPKPWTARLSPDAILLRGGLAKREALVSLSAWTSRITPSGWRRGSRVPRRRSPQARFGT
jgi:hypothetical protein